MLRIEDKNAVTRGQLLGYFGESDIKLKEEYLPHLIRENFIWFRCDYMPIEIRGDVTPKSVSLASTCTYWVNSRASQFHPSYQAVDEPIKVFLGDASNADRFEFKLEIPSHQTTEVQWVEFCQSLFPGCREHTPEERKAYSDFIDSFFEEVEI
jgi:hypothetical protein